MSIRKERRCMQQRVRLAINPPAVADHVLVRQTLAGDEGAFEALVRRYHLRVFHFIRRRVRTTIRPLMCSSRSCLNSLFPSQLCAQQENGWVRGSSALPTTAASMHSAGGAWSAFLTWGGNPRRLRKNCSHW